MAGVALLLLLNIDSPAPPAKQVLLIGVDGATWEIIDELRSQGRLPTYDRLIEAGARGELSVPSASISPSLWTTIATGVPPEVHGIEDFWVSSPQVAAKRLWEIADEHGLVSGSLGYLVTWPAVKETGFLVPGWLAQDNRTVPADISFLKDLEALEHSFEGMPVTAIARAALSALRRDAQPATVSRLLSYSLRKTFGKADLETMDLMRRELLIELSADVFCSLLDEYQPSLGLYYVHHVDAVEHLYFMHFRPEAFSGVETASSEAERQAIPNMYEATDRAIQRIAACAADGATLLILSDHGQRPGAVARRAMARLKSTSLLEHLGLDQELLATNVGDLVYVRARDASHSLAHAWDALRGVTWVRGGGPVFNVKQHAAGGLLISLRGGRREGEIQIGGRTVSAAELIDASQPVSGTHTQKAIVLMAGDDVMSGAKLPTGSLLDVAPTVLALLDLPLGRDMNGRVMLDALRPEVRAELELAYVDSHGAPEHWDAEASDQLTEEVQERLRSLGYIQ